MRQQSPTLAAIAFDPDYGRAVRTAEFDRPMMSDDVETAQTVAYMDELATFDAGERSVIDATHRALAEAGIDATAEPAAIVSAIFWFLKRTITYVPTPGTSALVDQTLIAPSALLAMRKPEGDCPQYSMLAAAMFRVCCIPCFFKTIAADPAYPDIYSHIYNVVQVGAGQFVPFDSSNGPAPGTEFARASKSRIWPRTNPDPCAQPVRSGMFAGTCSIGHALLGTMAALVPGHHATVAITGGFAFYEMLRAKPAQEKLSAFGEYGIGFAAGKAIGAFEL